MDDFWTGLTATNATLGCMGVGGELPTRVKVLCGVYTSCDVNVGCETMGIG